MTLHGTVRACLIFLLRLCCSFSTLNHFILLFLKQLTFPVSSLTLSRVSFTSLCGVHSQNVSNAFHCSILEILFRSRVGCQPKCSSYKAGNRTYCPGLVLIGLLSGFPCPCPLFYVSSPTSVMSMRTLPRAFTSQSVSFCVLPYRPLHNGFHVVSSVWWDICNLPSYKERRKTTSEETGWHVSYFLEDALDLA